MSETLKDSINRTFTNSYAYDYAKFDQLKQFTNAINKTWNIGLDSSGNATSVTDPIGRTWCAGYNSAGLLTSISDPATSCATALESFTYNSTLDLASATHRASDSETTTFSYDLVGRLREITSPLNETRNFTYDDKDEITTDMDGRGNTTIYTYDWNGDLQRLVDARQNTTTWNWSPPGTENTWNVKECDPKGNCAFYLIAGLSGQLSQYTDKRGVVNKFNYDNLGRLIGANYDVNNLLGQGTYHDAFVYDAADRLLGVTHGASGTPCAGSDGNSYADAFQYDVLDDITVACSPEGKTVNSFDNIGRRLSMSVQPPIGHQGANYSYTWDDANELTAMTNATLNYAPDGQRSILGVTNTNTTVTTTYTYDALSQRLTLLNFASTQNPALGTLTYTYDADGRVITKGGTLANVNLPPVSPQAATYASTNQIQTWTNNVSPSVDANEGITKDPATAMSYKYSARDEIWQAGSDQYTYDAGGRREIAGGVSYLYDGQTPAWISTGTGINIAALPDSNEIFNLNGVVPIRDALGTVLGGVNSNGALAFQNTYDPFGGFTTSGTPPSGYGQVYGMAGIEYDPTGLYHAGPRYYSPTLQRFLSEDPIRGKANMYSYAGNNPITGSDISGLQGDDCPLGDCAGGGGGGQENAPCDSCGLIGLVASILQDIFGGGSGGNPAPNYQRFQNEIAFGRFNESVGLSDNVLVLGQSGQNLRLSTDELGGIKLVQSSTIGGDDPDFKLEGPQREARIRELEQEVQNLPSGKERTRKLRKLQELRRRPSKQAHGADKNKGSSKLSIIPIIPEAPLGAGEAELPELLELLELGASAL